MKFRKTLIRRAFFRSFNQKRTPDGRLSVHKKADHSKNVVNDDVCQAVADENRGFSARLTPKFLQVPGMTQDLAHSQTFNELQEPILFLLIFFSETPVKKENGKFG